MHLVLGHRRLWFDDQICGCVFGFVATCPGHVGEERSGAGHRSPSGGELASIVGWGGTPGKTQQTQTYCKGLLTESPLRRSVKPYLLSPSGPCSMPPLLRQLISAVAARWSVPVVAVTPEPIGGHRKRGMPSS